MGLLLFLLYCFAIWGGTASASERIILVGPKTIGPGWKDNIILEARHFQDVKAGDVLTVYTDRAKRTAQGAFQDPQNWQAIAAGYGYFGIDGPFRLTFTDDILAKVRERGLAVGGHDYRIVSATITDGSDFQERIVWRGPSVIMKSDWSVNAEIPASCFRNLKVGDAMRFHVSRVQDGAAIKLSDFTWEVLDPTTNGASLGGDSYTYYIKDNAPLIKLQLAGTGDNVALRVGGKGYRLDRIGIVSNIGELIEDITNAQRAPREYELQPGELFHGEKLFPMDWSGNYRITAEPFQECTVNDVVILSYELLPEVTASQSATISFRENRGKWLDLSGSPEPHWQTLDGTDVVLTFDEQSLDKIKTSGIVVTGRGFKLTKMELITAQ